MILPAFIFNSLIFYVVYFLFCQTCMPFNILMNCDLVFVVFCFQKLMWFSP
jgi:hypothetical protein